MPVITNINDLKRMHERRVPRMFYDYAESGSWTEQTFRENTSDFDQIRLRQRVAVDMSGRSTTTQMIGQDVAMPVALAPVGRSLWRAIHPFHDVDKLDRGCGRGHDQAILVSTLHHA